MSGIPKLIEAYKGMAGYADWYADDNDDATYRTVAESMRLQADLLENTHNMQVIHATNLDSTTLTKQNAALSCSITNATIVVNDGNPVSYGGGPYSLVMDWTKTDGSYGGAAPVTGLSASVGTVSYVQQSGAHPTNEYIWTPPSSGSAVDVDFSYGEDVGGVQCTATAVVSLAASVIAAPHLALEGFGTDSDFARDLVNGTAVVPVTNLNDSGAGSLREATQNRSDKRYIIPLVDGTLTTQSTIYGAGSFAMLGAASNMLVRTVPNNGYVTLLMNAPNQLVRFMKLASGQTTNSSEGARKPIQSESYNHVVDHCSLLFGVDDLASIYQDFATVDNITYSYNLFGIGLQRSHTGTVTSGKGMLISSGDASFHHNVMYSGSYRAPQISNEFTQAINNLTLGMGPLMVGEVYDLHDVQANVVNNINLSGDAIDHHASRHGDTGRGVGPKAISYIDGNVDANGNPLPVIYQRGDANWATYNTILNSPITTSPSGKAVPTVTTHTTAELEAHLLSTVGAYLQGRTDVETDILNRVAARTNEAFDAVAGDALYPTTYAGDPAVYARQYSGWPTIPTAGNINTAFDQTQVDLVPNSWKTSKGIAANADTTKIDLLGNGTSAFEVFYEEVTGCPPY